MNKFLLVCLGVLFGTGAFAQSGSSSRRVHVLTLASSIEMAKEQSRDMQLLRLRTESAGYNLKMALSANRTRIDMELTMPRYSESIRQFEDSTGISFYPIKQTMMSGTLTVSQPLPTDGRLYLSTGAQSTADFNDDTRNAQLTSTIGFSQPIEAAFGFNSNRLAYKQAKLNYEVSLKQLQREELNMVYNTSQLFYNLLSSRERVKIAQMTMERQREAFELAESKFQAGLIREVDALQMEVDLTEAANNLDGAQVSYQERMESFKEFLGIDMRDSLSVEDDLSFTVVEVDEEKAVQLAFENRLELKENSIEIELQKMSIKRARAAGKVSGDINLTYNFMGVDKSLRDDPVRSSFESSWENLRDRKGSFGASLSVNIPIVDWGGNRARVAMALSTLQQYQIQDESEKISIEREMRSSVAQLRSALRRFLALEKSVVIAEKSFEISRERYANGDIDSQAIALDRERLNNAYISRLEAYISYRLMLSDIMRKTFFDFEKGISMVK